MLKIIVNGHEVDLGDLKGIALKLNPGIFDNDSTDGSYTIPFSLPASIINNTIFGFPYKIGSINRDVREYPAELWHSGIKFKEGTISAKLFDDETISCDLYVDNGGLYKDFNEKLLPENDFGGYKSWVDKTPQYNYLTDDFVMYRAENEDYFQGSAFYDVTNDLRKSQNLYNTTLKRFTFNSLIPSIITPFPLLWRTLSALFLNKGFRYFDSFFSATDYNTINIFNTVNALEPQYYQSGGQTYARSILTRYNIANHLPKMPTSDFIRAIQNFFNVKFYVREFQVQVLDRLQLISSTGYSDISARAIGAYTKELTGNKIDGIAFSILRDEADDNVSGLEDISGAEIIAIVNTNPYNIVNPAPYTYALERLTLGDYTKQIWSKYINQKDYDLMSGSFWFWKGLPFITTDVNQFNQFANQNGLYFGNRDFEINLGLSSVPNCLFGEIVGNYPYQLPKLKQKGNSYFHSLTNPFSLRLMQYNGIQSVEGITQPTGSVSRNGVSMTAHWSYYSRWKDYIDWWSEVSKENYTQKFKLTAAEIKNFNFAEKKLVNNELFFVKDMSFQLLRSSVGEVTCNLIKAQ